MTASKDEVVQYEEQPHVVNPDLVTSYPECFLLHHTLLS